MSTTRKFYTRVKENLVMLVEIHALATDSGQSHWFEDKHLQETVQIVKEAIESRLTQTQSAVKGTQQNSSIITGDSIRLGYVFKVRPSSQHCLLPPSSLTQQEHQELEEEDLHSLAVAKEKLIIYVCQRQVGSPQGMSQLVRVLGEKTNSTSKGVSISSYFHRVSGGTKSGLSSTTSSPGPAAVAQKSGGKRNILKKILQQADKNVSRKKQQKSTKAKASKRDSTIHKFLGKEVESDSSNKAAATAKTSPESLPNSSAEVRTEKVSNALSQSIDNAAQKSQNTAEVSMNTSEYKVKVTQINTMSGRVSNQEDKPGEMEPSTIKISQVFNAPVPLNTEENNSVGSVTLISVDQMHEIQQQKLASYQPSVDCHSPVSLVVSVPELQSHDISCDQARPHSSSDPDESILPSASFISQPGGSFQSPIVSVEVDSKPKAPQTKVQQRIFTPPNVDRLSDGADSPVFSKKKSEKSIPVNILDDTSNSDNRFPEGDTQVTDKEKLNDPQNGGGDGETKQKHQLPSFSDSDSDKDTDELSQSCNKHPAGSRTRRSNKENKRLKRKLPDFHDSDSDDIELPLINRISRHQNRKKFVRLDEMKQNTKKYSISKSFFSGKDEKLQPTLSFFMNDKSKKSRSEKMNESEIELNKEELENLDCTLIEELASAVKVKGGSDSEIMKEIRELREVDELNEEHLNFMVRHSESYLRDIFEGKIHSSRHMAYKKGGISKRDLNYGSCLNLYSEEQIDTVMEALMKIFCKRHHKYLDYIMKVLLPEMLIKFHMEIHNLTKEESEKKLLP